MRATILKADFRVTRSLSLPACRPSLEHVDKHVKVTVLTMQSANELLRVLHLRSQAFHLVHQLHQCLSLLNVFCLDLQAKSGHVYSA